MDSPSPEHALRSVLWLALKSLLATVLLPGVVTGYLPWRYFGLRAVDVGSLRPAQIVALPVLVVGSAILLTCIWEFARSGRGTLAPVAPPKHLVIRGLYRYVRNPMYVGVFTILLGELLLVRSTVFLAYVLGFGVMVNVFVIGYEEPTLRRLFGDEYRSYCARVRRWIPHR